MAPKYITCGGCMQITDERETLKCCLCSKRYDLLCANVSQTRFYSTMQPEHKAKWKCCECRNKEPRRDNTNTPVKQTGSHLNPPVDDDQDHNNVTLRNKVAISASPVASPTTVDPQMAIVTELRLLREDMKAMHNEMRDFKDCLNALMTAVTALNARVDNLEGEQKCSESAEVASLKQTVDELRRDINERDQEMLSNDVEIAGIHEEKGERPMHLVLSVANKLGVELEERDVVFAMRAGAPRDAAGGSGARPRTLVVRLTRRDLRDQLLRAARVRRGATTADMGLASPPATFYVNERLTWTNRQLFRKAREGAARSRWRYVWTWEGKIFARKEHGSTRHRLRSDDDLLKIFGQ